MFVWTYVLHSCLSNCIIGNGDVPDNEVLYSFLHHPLSENELPGKPSGNASGTFRYPSGIQCFWKCGRLLTFSLGRKRNNVMGNRDRSNLCALYKHSVCNLSGIDWILWAGAFWKKTLELQKQLPEKPSGNASGTFWYPSGMRCFAHSRKPSGIASGIPSGTFRYPSGMRCFEQAPFFHLGIWNESFYEDHVTKLCPGFLTNLKWNRRQTCALRVAPEMFRYL